MGSLELGWRVGLGRFQKEVHLSLAIRMGLRIELFS